ncbi:MAG: hypothetical protein AAGJ40_23235 [Planctomycetota bacterium]
MIRTSLAFLVVCVASVAVAPQADAGLFGLFKKKGCCEPAPACCPEPEPVCCEPAPEPICCEPAPAPVCCEPAPAPEPVCCEPAPAPVCCEPAPAPVCCPAPEPVCCEPARVGLFARLKAKIEACRAKRAAAACCTPCCP